MASEKSPPRVLPPAAASSSDSTLSSAVESSDKPSSTSNGSSKGGSADAPATRDTPMANGLQSQPMTTTTSASSDHATAAEPASSTNTPAAYGTRSRNRHGTSRPNYAEDGDGDMEFEAALAVPRGSRKAAASSAQNSVNASPATDGDRTSGVSTRRAHATANENAKDAIPGTSSFFAGPTANNGATASKKRKQNNTQSSPASAAPSASAKKTDSTAIQYSNSQTQSDTNMPSFENCGGHLKDGKLIADDGTVYEVNGM